jgi:hypothetical protein
VQSYHCALLEVSKESVPIGSKLWLLEEKRCEMSESR